MLCKKGFPERLQDNSDDNDDDNVLTLLSSNCVLDIVPSAIWTMSRCYILLTNSLLPHFPFLLVATLNFLKFRHEVSAVIRCILRWHWPLDLLVLSVWIFLCGLSLNVPQACPLSGLFLSQSVFSCWHHPSHLSKKYSWAENRENQPRQATNEAGRKRWKREE